MHTSPIVCSLMYGGLVSTGPASYRTFHIMNSINPWIHLLNEFIYNWKSPISLSAQSCAILVALWYLTQLVIFPFININLLICAYVVCTRQAKWLGGWFDLSCVVLKSWFDVRCVVLNFLSDTSCRPTVGINMNGLFLQEPPYRKTTKKVWQNTIRNSARWCKFWLEDVS